MAGFSLNIGGFLNAPVNGLKRGVEYDLEFAKMFVDAAKHNKQAELHDLVGVMEAFILEAADSAGIVKGNIANLVLGAAIGTNSDPFSGSRHKMQDVEKKYGKPGQLVSPHP